MWLLDRGEKLNRRGGAGDGGWWVACRLPGGAARRKDDIRNRAVEWEEGEKDAVFDVVDSGMDINNVVGPDGFRAKVGGCNDLFETVGHAAVGFDLGEDHFDHGLGEYGRGNGEVVANRSGEALDCLLKIRFFGVSGEECGDLLGGDVRVIGVGVACRWIDLENRWSQWNVSLSHVK